MKTYNIFIKANSRETLYNIEVEGDEHIYAIDKGYLAITKSKVIVAMFPIGEIHGFVIDDYGITTE